MLILPKLTRDYVLEYISQEDIFTKYLGISHSIVSECLDYNTLICSPLRSDENPTFGFYTDYRGKIRGNDFAGYFHGDCFDAVGYQHHLDSSNRVDMAIILDIIAKDFSLWYYSPEYFNADFSKKSAELREKYSIAFSKKEFTQIEIVQERNWTYVDSTYWTKKYNLTEVHLQYYDVHLPYVLKLNGKVIYTYSHTDPCYAYLLGYEKVLVGKDYIQYPIYKLYFPLRKKGTRWITNGRKLQGIRQLQSSNTGILTKSLKDVMVARLLGINAVAVAGETIEPTKKEMDYILSKVKTLYSLMDYDYAGIRMAQNLKRKYGIKPLFFTNGKYDTVDFGAKDLSDFIEEKGFDTTKEFIDFIKSNGVNNDSEFWDYYSHYLT